jgi:hypothetical protein
MATLDPKNPSDSYQKAAEDRYWKIVREIIKEIFNSDVSLVDQYLRDLQEATPDERALVYHAEPLDVAADLVGTRPTREHVDLYRKMIYDIPLL